MIQRTLSLGVLVLLALALTIPSAGVQSAPVAAPVAAPLSSAFGINTNIASRHPIYETLHEPADTVVDLGAGWVREDFQFFRINPQPGEFDWSWHDRMVDLFEERGVSIIGVLNGPSPGWATPASDAELSFYPPDPAQYAAFASAVVERYRGRVTYWQVWNEPDNAAGLYWRPGPNMVEYANLLRTAYPAIKEANPDAQVLVGSMVSPQPAATSLQTLYDQGAWNSFDIISLHPYTDPRGPEDGQIDVAGIGTVRGLAERLGPKPIWATEYGWSTGPADRTAGQGVPIDESTQANYLIRGSVLLRSAGVNHVIWYSLKDTESVDGHPHNMYGLLDYDPTRASYNHTLRKPAYLAYQVMTQQLAGTTTATPLDLNEQVSVLNFEQFGTWRRGDEPNGELTQSSEQAHSGQFSARLAYNFGTAGNDYVVFLPASPVPISGSPGSLGVWIYGDGSGHALNVWLRDSQGEVLQYRLGPVGSSGWNYVSAPLGGAVDPANIISGQANGRLDFPISLTAIVLDDDPNTAIGSGVIYLDDMVATSGSESYAVRFPKANSNEVVDVIWATTSAQVKVPTNSPQATMVRAWGESSSAASANGLLSFTVGPDPVFLHHVPGTAPSPGTDPGDQVGPITPPGPDQRCFDATGHCISGRIREYWEENGGLSVFGYPITPQRQEVIEGQTLQVQWFERNRLELHPENQRPYDVLLGRLGAGRLEQMGRVWHNNPRSAPQAGCRYFDETGHNVCGEILAAWRADGLELDGRPGKTEAENLALFGMPLGDVQTETIEGRQIQVQWFERARFELHPENAPPHNVLLGLLGNETMQP
jgi:hypothetical protein